MNRNLDDFINWDVIQSSMFYEPPSVEYNKVMNSGLSFAIKKSDIGNPKPYFLDKGTSGNDVHQAYNLSMILDRCYLSDISQVIEIGGGYGTMCKLFKELEFDGKYFIFDIPEFTHLQYYYLKSSKENYICTTHFTSTPNSLELEIKPGTLLIGTWSISEMPIELRRLILRTVQFDYLLIAFQAEFEGVNNIYFFTEFMQQYPDIDFRMFQVGHLPGNYYLTGIPKKN